MEHHDTNKMEKREKQNEREREKKIITLVELLIEFKTSMRNEWRIDELLLLRTNSIQRFDDRFLNINN